MKRKKYWQDVRQSFSSSWGRTLSIIFLLSLGAMTLIGLKVTGPNMERTAQQFTKTTDMFNLAVTSNYGLSSKDVQELKSLRNTRVEFGYFEDSEVKGTNQAIRVFSKTDSISKNKLISGKMPVKNDQIALSYTMKGKYKIGDQIQFDRENNEIQKHRSYKIVGFIKSAEIWSNNSMRASSVGTGELDNYAATTKGAFNSKAYTIARLTYDNLTNVKYNSSLYKSREKIDQRSLNKILKDNETQRLSKLTTMVTASGHSLLKSTSISKAKYTVYNRNTLPGGDGYTTYDSSTTSISAIGNIFPIILYLVAALVSLTTMTRFVDEERNNAGIFRSLGYSKLQIIGKFVIFGLVTSMIGTFIGILIGEYGLSRIIGGIVSKGMVIGNTNLYFYPSYILITVILALLATVFPAYLVARRELSEESAYLLLPKPPVAGSTILLEKITFIWKRMSFTHKVTARNVFRYKQRMLMTIFGVAGSIALLFTGIGIQSSIRGVSKNQFGQILKYDMIVSQNPLASQPQKQQLSDFLNKRSSGQKKIEIKQLNQKVSGNNDKQKINLLIAPTINLDGYVNLRNRIGKQKIKLTNNGAIISEKLADLYQAKEGDNILLKLNGQKVKIKVTGITEMYAGHFIYMTKDYYQKTTKSRYRPNAELIKLKNKSGANIENTAAKLLKIGAVSSVSQNTALIKMLNKFSISMQSVTIILIVLSFMLAIVILYNLTNINISERIRELSTIKVLGFHTHEVTMYIYRETIILSMAGAIFGLIGGLFLHRKIIKMIVSDEIMFNPTVGLSVYVIPVLLVGSILIILGWLVDYKLRKVDMLGALKSDN
ncbi:ABC transporter permease [Oenococcus sp. UCMA 17063]|nr:ABC transporter permease [Oenococcus sp. UCMA 17063]